MPVLDGFSRLYQWFQPPIFDGNEEKTYRARLLSAMINAAIFFMLVFLPIVFPDQEISILTKITDLSVLLTCLLLRRSLMKGRIQIVSVAIEIVLFAAVTCAIAGLATLKSPTTAAYFFIVITSGVLFGLAGILVATAASSLAIGAFYIALTNGFLVEQVYHFSAVSLTLYALMLITAGGLSYFSLQTTLRALKSANNEIRERTQIEAMLRSSEARFRSLSEQLSTRVMEIERLHQAIQDQAIHDPLTGLFNRRYLSETLPGMFDRMKLEGSRLSIIIGDIDHFKNINDRFGHQAGDHFLVQIAAEMKKLIRSSDIICRYGGEEFLIILPGAPAHIARERSEEIRRAIENIQFPIGDHEIRVSISLGIATSPEDGASVDEVIFKADKALYHSKQNGRNQVSHWDRQTA